MNKRGQVYILAAIILSLAIFSVMKVTNKFVAPNEDNFDFFIENFEGERSYVMNLGLLEEQEGGVLYYLKGTAYEQGLLQIFQEFGINTGIVLIEYTGGSWKVINYLGNIITADCENCEEFSLPSAEENLAEVSFSVTKGGKKWSPGEGTSLQDYGDEGYFTYEFPGSPNSITVKVNENDYVFDKPLGGGDRVESIVFRNIDKNYVKVVSI